MIQTLEVRPPNSLLYVTDTSGGVDPDQTGEHLRWTDSSVSITCYTWVDGPTRVTLGAADEIDMKTNPVFDMAIATPSREIMISTIEWDVLLKAKVKSERTRVRIWENDPRWPDDIVIAVG